jgi:tripartite-type tricarboxylate transporter receptor subunit TctC
LLLASGAAAQPPIPKGPVRMIVPFPAGGGVDAAGRILAQALSENIGKPFVIENRGGANGNIGTEAAAHAAPDGSHAPLHRRGPRHEPEPLQRGAYDPVKDFEPVSLMALGPNILAVHPSLPVHSVRELIAAAKGAAGRDRLRGRRQRQHAAPRGRALQQHGGRADGARRPIAAPGGDHRPCSRATRR